MPNVTDIFRKTHEYNLCVMADVEPHFAKIKHWIPEEEHSQFKDRMFDCVEDETAWCTKNTFLYYNIENPGIANGVALFGQENAQELIGLFIGIFGHQDKRTHMLRFKLHPGKFMEEYKSLLTTVSMKRSNRDPNHPVGIRIDQLRNKICRIFDSWGLRG